MPDKPTIATHPMVVGLGICAAVVTIFMFSTGVTSLGELFRAGETTPKNHEPAAGGDDQTPQEPKAEPVVGSSPAFPGKPREENAPGLPETQKPGPSDPPSKSETTEIPGGPPVFRDEDREPEKAIPWYEECWKRAGHPEDECPPPGSDSKARERDSGIFGPRTVRFINDCGEARTLALGLTDDKYGGVDEPLVRTYESVHSIAKGGDLPVAVNLEAGTFTWEELSADVQMGQDRSRPVGPLDAFRESEYLSLEKIDGTPVVRLSCDDR